MLAAQMAAVHVAAMKLAAELLCFESFAQRDNAERAFSRLTRTFAMQLETLMRLRAGGAQTVTHVSVNDNAQAIVGNVTQTPRENVLDKTAAASPPALTHDKTAPMPIKGVTADTALSMTAREITATSASRDIVAMKPWKPPPQGAAHDIALKVAETDATKRALATFGKPFGLELYRGGRAAPSQKPLPRPIPRDQILTTAGLPVHGDPAAAGTSIIVPAAPGLVPAQIDKSLLTIAEPKRLRDKAHLRFVTSQPCLVCGRQPSDPHHLRLREE
jgi:Rad52/22 family double-strand break repair protein